MKISCSSVCYAHLPLEDTLRKISSAGFKNLELVAVRGWIHIDAGEISAEKLDALCRKNNLTLTALHAGNIDTSSDDTANKGVSYIKSVIDLAQKLAVDKIVFTGGIRKGGPRTGSTLSRYIQGLKELVKYIEGKDIHLCIENHYKNEIETIEDMQRVVEEIEHPQVGLTADTGHFTSSQISLDDVIDKLGSKIKHVHIKDHKGTRSVSLGMGDTNNKEFVKNLSQIGYQGELSMELEVEDKENTDTYVKEGYRYMNNLLRLS